MLLRLASGSRRRLSSVSTRSRLRLGWLLLRSWQLCRSQHQGRRTCSAQGGRWRCKPCSTQGLQRCTALRCSQLSRRPPPLCLLLCSAGGCSRQAEDCLFQGHHLLPLRRQRGLCVSLGTLGSC